MAAGSALVGTAAFANMSEVSEAAGFSSPVDFKGAYVGSDSDKTGLGAKGWLYFTDDGTGTIYKHDGSGWVDLGIGGSSVWEDADGDGVYSLKNGSGISIEQLQYALGNTGFSGRLSDRPMVSEQARTLTVGTDTSTIQEALNEIPLILRHRFEVKVPDGTYDEDLLIPPCLVADAAGLNKDGSTPEGASHFPRITGNMTSPKNVQVNSILATGVQGTIAPLIEGINVTGTVPNGDESVGVAIYGCQNVSLRRLSFEGTTANWGILAYSSQVTVREDTHFGNDDLAIGVVTKHQAQVLMDYLPGTDYPYSCIGSVTDHVIRAEDGSTATLHKVNTTAGISRVEWTSPEMREAFIYSSDDGGLFGGDWRMGDYYLSGARDGKNYIRQMKGHPIGFMTHDSNGDDVIRAILETTTGNSPASENTHGDLQFRNETGVKYPSGAGYKLQTENLSGKTGRYDQETRKDDGTNTPSGHPEQCYWDATNSVWRPASDPTMSFS
jgi:hypothetical protein